MSGSCVLFNHFPRESTARQCVSGFKGKLDLRMLLSRCAPLRLTLLMAACSVFSAALLQGQVSVLTSRYDNGRTGLNANETFLNSANVNQATFAKLGAYNVDGYVVAQPLYMPNVSIGGSSYNVVFIATQHDSVYAFDADNLSSGAPLWQVSFINSAAGITTVPISEQGCAGVNGYTEMGIQGTPVIDSLTGTLYVNVKTKEVTGSTTSYVHRLHALDITNGQEKFGGPVQITGSVQSLHGTVTFDSTKSCQRPGFLLSNGTLYIAFGSNGCDTNHGWVFAYNPTTLAQVGVFNSSPNQTRGAGIWQGGAGLVGDQNGNVFFLTANGTFNVNTGGSDIGDSFVKLALGTGGLSLSDYFTPYDQGNMNTNDLDLGSGGVMLLANLGGQHPNVAIGAGKSGTIYVVDPNNMGGFNSNNNNQIIQWLQSAINEVDGTPAYWNNTVFFAPDHASAVSYSLSNGKLSSLPIAQTQPIIPAGGPIVSANGLTNGIVWIVRSFGSSAKQLSAFDATKMLEIYNTTQAGTRDTLGNTPHFVVPAVADGRVFVGTQTQLVIYGLMPVLSAVSGGNQTGTAGSTLPAPLTIQATDPYTGAPLAGVTVTFSGKGTFGNPTPVTDSTGTASTTYTLPTTFTSSTVTITVSATGYASTTFVETVTPGSPASISSVSGASQTGTAGTTLPKAIVFKVADQYGNAVPGVSVSFSDSPNHGVFSANPVTTDSSGKATVTYTLPTKAGFNTVTASTASLSASVQEHVVAGSPASLKIVSGNNQTAPTNTTLSKQLTVKVTDQYGNAVSGVTVNYTDNGANGIFSSTTAITNASGQAGVSYTTPSTPGTVTINATVTGLPSVVFTVNVT
jgi:hypothetical protein